MTYVAPFGDYDANPKSIDEWHARRILAGWTPQAIATAGEMTIRTAYRWKAALVRLEVVELDGFRATFAIRRDGPPCRLTPWERVG